MFKNYKDLLNTNKEQKRQKKDGYISIYSVS